MNPSPEPVLAGVRKQGFCTLRPGPNPLACPAGNGTACAAGYADSSTLCSQCVPVALLDK